MGSSFIWRTKSLVICDQACNMCADMEIKVSFKSKKSKKIFSFFYSIPLPNISKTNLYFEFLSIRPDICTEIFMYVKGVVIKHITKKAIEKLSSN